MKTIIVAVDFSKWSKFALKYAVYLANKINSDILMVWVDKDPAAKPFYNDVNADYLSSIKAQFDQLIEKNSKKLLNHKLEYKILKGKVYTALIEQSASLNAYLIIAGTHGISGFEEFWIGSNAYRIVASSVCPVITIHNGYCVHGSSARILMPIDSTLESRQKVPFTTDLAKSLDAEIQVLGLYPSAVDEIRNTVNVYTTQTINYLKKHDAKFTLSYVEVENHIADTIINFVKNNQIDLVSIVTEHDIRFSNLYLGTYAQQIVNHCPVPVITVNTTENYELGSA